jgi:uncharacterized iron-regulated protein
MRSRAARAALVPLPALAVLSSLACASPSLVQRAEQPIGPGRPWVTELRRDHPLVGKIYDARRGELVSEAALREAVAGADFVLLGETHDNPDHHVLQARLVRFVAEAGRRPVVAFEMLDTSQQHVIDQTLARSPRDPDALGKALAWDESGWPRFEVYRPIFAAALDAGLPVAGANLPKSEVRGSVKEGAKALPEVVRAWLEREGPPPEEVLASLREEMNESHCGELPAAMLDPLILAQRARDARMAERMVTLGEGRGAILIAGAGHVRRDRGVPAWLAREAPGKKVIAVGFQEVKADATTPDDHAEWYGAEAQPFDFVVFTPAVEREDPCESFRRHMEKKRRHEAAPVG